MNAIAVLWSLRSIVTEGWRTPWSAGRLAGLAVLAVVLSPIAINIWQILT